VLITEILSKGLVTPTVVTLWDTASQRILSQWQLWELWFILHCFVASHCCPTILLLLIFTWRIVGL